MAVLLKIMERAATNSNLTLQKGNCIYILAGILISPVNGGCVFLLEKSFLGIHMRMFAISTALVASEIQGFYLEHEVCRKHHGWQTTTVKVEPLAQVKVLRNATHTGMFICHS